MKLVIIGLAIVAAVGNGAQAQGRSNWDFFNPRAIPRKAPSQERVRQVEPLRSIENTDSKVRDVGQSALPELKATRERTQTPFDILVAQCAAIESQFGRTCNDERVSGLLATSAVFESDATRVIDSLPNNIDVVAAANQVLKESTSADLKTYAWTVLYEDAAFHEGDMHLLMKSTKTLRMNDFANILKEKEKKNGAVEGAPTPGGSSGTGGASFAKKDTLLGSSCLKVIPWKMPKAGGQGNTSSDDGKIPTGPDGKPLTPAETLAGGKADCSQVDPSKLSGGDDTVGYNPDKAKDAKQPWSETVGMREFEGSGKGQHGSGLGANNYDVSGFTKEKASFAKAADGEVILQGTQYEHTIVTIGKNGQGAEEQKVVNNSPTPPKTVTTNKGDVVTVTAGATKGTGTGTLKDGEKKTDADKKAELEKPKKKEPKKGYDNPMGDGESAEQACPKNAQNAFQNCVMGAFMKDFEKDDDQDYCDQKGWVASGIDCSKKTGATKEELDKQMFIKSGGGWTDPNPNQYKNDAAQQPGADSQGPPQGQQQQLPGAGQ